MEKSSIGLLAGIIGAILAILAAAFVFLQYDPKFGETLNVIAIAMIIAGVVIFLIASAILAKKNRNRK
ncbi:hypothetical protein [Amycolatopsis sp. NBC_01480]|uniref:hypothetical protein n=1 Tax=Amycolatopsis sp. NBC_01480 TaxID=2903562 RepID=UPI002E292ACC|nr:hypothetical protein [Amycolatopsis sp. NBC_01480]